METEYSLRVTIAVPPKFFSEANQLALCLGESPNDDRTFTNLSHTDSEGNRYCVVSTVVKPVFKEMMGTELEAPSYAPLVNLESAEIAKSLTKINSGPANKEQITAVLGDRAESSRSHYDYLEVKPIPLKE